MRKSIGTIVKTSMVAAVAGGAIMMMAPAAQAVTHTCTIDWAGKCASGYVPAHASGHWVRISTKGDASWKIVDVDNGRVVNSGRGSVSKKVYGLYGTYQLRMDGSFSKGYLSNTN